jgi:hypothetical protein
MLIAKNNLKNVCGLLDYIYLCKVINSQTKFIQDDRTAHKRTKKSAPQPLGAL